MDELGQYTAPVDPELEDIVDSTVCWDHPTNIDGVSEIICVIKNSAILACHSDHIFFNIIYFNLLLRILNLST